MVRLVQVRAGEVADATRSACDGSSPYLLLDDSDRPSLVLAMIINLATRFGGIASATAPW
jgi:hypothetical protein